MRFEIGLVKKLTLALALVAFAGDALAADDGVALVPLNFSGVSAAQQEDFWSELMTFKMWGTDSMSFGHASMPGSSGAVGTTGGLSLPQGNHTIGGAIYVGHDISGSTGTDTIFTGPVRVKGDFNEGPNANFFYGTYCVEGSATSPVRRDLKAAFEDTLGVVHEQGRLYTGASAKTGACSYDNIKDVPMHLSIPSLSGASFQGEKSVNNGNMYIDVPPLSEGRQHDFFFEGIKTENDSKLYIRMQSSRSLARIFLNKTINLSSSTIVQIIYVDENAKFVNGAWTNVTEPYAVPNEDYAGNVLFYMNWNMDWSSSNGGTYRQGTYMSKGDIKVGSNLKLAGQLLATNLYVDHEFDGRGFRYVPFNPPVVDIVANDKSAHLKEGNAYDVVKIVLDKPAEERISFQYCFLFEGNENAQKGDGSKLAHISDLTDTDLPLFNGTKCSNPKTAYFDVDSVNLTNPIILHVTKDSRLEDDETFKMRIENLDGATLPNGNRNGFITLTIDDGNSLLSSSGDAEITVAEDTKYYFKAEDFKVTDIDGDPWTGDFGILVVTPPHEDSLKTREKTGDKKEAAVEYNKTIGGTLIGVPKGMLSGDMAWDLVYNPPKDSFGVKYDSLRYVVLLDGNASKDTFTLYINITPVNDAPVISPVTFKIKENVVRGDVNGDDYASGSLSAVVEDVDDEEFTYKFDDEFDSENTKANYEKVTSLYDLDPTTGKIVVKEGAELNYESADSLLQIRVVVTDKSASTGNPEDAETGKTIITIQMLDVNEKPVMEPQSFEVMENSKKGTVVGTVVATDPDRSTVDFGKLVYSIPETENVPFAVSSSGVITVTDSTMLDYEKVMSISFNVIVSDKGDPSLKDTAIVTINIQDVNEPPEFIDDGKDGYDVDEHVAEDFEVARLKFVDRDAADSKITDFIPTLTDKNKTSGKVSAEDLFELSIEKDAESDTFYVVITVADSAKLDYEKLAASEKAAVSFDVTISIKDGEGAEKCNEVSIDRKLNVNDVNEAPTIADVIKKIDENLPKGTPVDTLKATDPDTKNSDFGTLTYTILGQDTVPFVLDSKDPRIIRVNDRSKLDYETNDTLIFYVEVSDGELADTAKILFALNDVGEPPIIIVVPDCDPETEVCHVCDAMIQDCGNPDEPPQNCTENCGYQIGDTLYVSVLENSVGGTKILEYYVKDEDVDDLANMDVTFDNTNKSGADSLFTITPKLKKDGNGYKFELSVKEGAKLDYEKVNESHRLVITVKDGKDLTDEILRVIKIVDVNEAPTIEGKTFYVDENSEKGTKVGALKASDPDVKHPKEFGTLTYTIVEDDTPFMMDSNIVRVADGSKLNYEELDYYEIHVKVSDGEYSAVALVKIFLNNTNEEPFIKCLEDDDNCEGPYDIAENSKTGTVIHTFAVDDNDKNPAYRLNAASISDVNGRNAKDLFAIRFIEDSTKVEVFVKDGAKLDYEKVDPNYTVKIKIADAMGVADSIIRVINVVDVNEAPSIADNSFKIDENKPNGTVVGAMVASDPDIKNIKFSTLTYEILDDVPFKMDSNKVVVSDASRLNYEKNTEFYFDVRVSDGQYSDVATVYVKLNDVEEPPEIVIIPDCDPAVEVCHVCDAMIQDCDDPIEPPQSCTENCGYLKGDTVYLNVAENAPTGTKILEYFVKDEDVGDLKTMKVTFVDNNKSGSDSLFTVTPKLVTEDGTNYKFELTVTDGDKLDYEKTNHVHKISIIVTDEADLADTIVRVVKIIDINEPPFIVKDEFDLNEHNKAGAVVGTIEWGDDKDMDGISNPAFRENVVVAVDGATDVFDVDEKGVITVKKTLNYETDDSTYQLIVRVQDKNDPTLGSTDTMIVHLKNILEKPVITSTEFTIPENPKDKAVIGQITSEDMDDLKNEEKRTYTLVGTSDFVTVTEDGKIVVKDSTKFDYEKTDKTKIQVRVTDPQGVSSDTTITIKITDVNEAPTLKDKTIEVSEFTKPNTVIDTLKATDPDKDPKYRDLTYKIVEGDTTLFSVDPKTGVLTLKDSLDYETKKEHVLKVEVNDGEFADTAKITVNVENEDEESVVVIEKVNELGGDSASWTRPDSVFSNQTKLEICHTQDDNLICSDTTLTEGIHVIVKKFKDPKKDKEGRDIVVIHVSTAAPTVIVSAKADSLAEGNIYTISEGVAAGDTSIYVNDSKNDIRVTVKDPVTKKDSSFVVKLDLETKSISKDDLKTVSSVVDKNKFILNESPKGGATHTPVNGNEVKVSYTEETTDGKKVQITYYTDNKGEVLLTPVINEKGKIDSIEVITVSYTTKIGGKDVVVSYQADAKDGTPLHVGSDGSLSYEDKISVPVSIAGKPSEAAKDSAKTEVELGLGSYQVSYEYEDAKHNTVVVTYTVDEKGKIVKNADGDIGYTVSYTYTNKFGNSATQSVFIVLDQILPVVKIVSPSNMETIRSNSVEVVWTVDGIVQDTLTLQGLKKGFQTISRVYRDKAGNEARDSIIVIMKDGKDVDLAVVEAVVEMDQNKVDEYYAANPPKKGENAAISIKNPSTGKEVEVLTLGDYGQKKGTFDEPYPGVKGNGHLGPTLSMDVRLPTVNNVGGLATLDDLVGSDGMVSLNGVDAKNAEKVTVDEYVKTYCKEGFKYDDITKANLYNTRMHAKIWIYTSIGNFVDYFNYKIDLNDPEYTDKAGMLSLYFENKPDKDGLIHTDDGQVLATGAYLYKVEADIRAELLCTLPPVKDAVTEENQKKDSKPKKKGDVLKKSDELLKPFGYKRPVKK